MKIAPVKRFASGLLSLSLLVPQGLLAQTVSTEQLMETIKKLEARVAELEGKTTPAASPSPPAQKAADSGATTPPAPTNENSWAKGMSWEAMVDGYYGYNWNRPANRTNPLRNFDTSHNQFSLNLAELVIQKKAEPVGFRIDLDFGPATEIVHAAEPGGVNTFHNIQQAYFTYVAPVGKGLTFDFGKFVTPHGAEVIETRDNFNYSRSLLFAWAIPYYHFGLRTSYPVTDKFAVNFHLVNGWNNVVDNNTGKTVGTGFSWALHKKLTWIMNYMAGPEQANNNDNWRHLWDTTVSYAASDKVTFVGNYDYGLERIGPNSNVHWTGAAGYMKIQANPWFALIPRLEIFNDHDGFTTTVGQRIKEFTMTTEFKLHPNIVSRLEYRRDWSDKEFFARGSQGTLVKNQDTALAGLFFTFGSPK